MKNLFKRKVSGLAAVIGICAMLVTGLTGCDEEKDDNSGLLGLLLAGAGYDVTLAGDQLASVTIASGARVLLRGTVRFTTGTTLTIGAGATIYADPSVLSLLIIDKGARINAVGTVLAPITFTSGKPEGQRATMDWGGIIIAGNAQMFGDTADAGKAIEGDETHNYGGTDDNDDSGTLTYVRVYFAGYPFTTDKELNGIAFHGVGDGTTVDYVQVHRGGDDGIEMFGGKFDAKHLVCTDNIDDQIDVTEGYRGNIQFVVAGVPNSGEFIFEWDAKDTESSTASQPRSNVNMSNVTLVGNKNLGSLTGTDLKDDMFARIANVYILNVAGFALYSNTDQQDIVVNTVLTEYCAKTGGNVTGMANMSFGGGTFTVTNGTASSAPATTVLDRANFLTGASLAAAGAGAFAPTLGATNVAQATTGYASATTPAVSSDFTAAAGFTFDTGATYVGAVPAGGTNWLDGWCEFPIN